MSATRKAYIVILIEDSEPTLVELHDTLRDASNQFQRLLRDDPEFIEDEVYRQYCLQPAVASARDRRGNLVLIVERSICLHSS